MKPFFRILNKALKSLDLFPTSNFLRYSGENEYTTASGGVISVAICVVFAVLFASMGIRTINRQIITASVNSINDLNPTPLSLVTSPKNNFMLSIGLLGFNLSDQSFKLFDISMTQTYYTGGFTFLNQTIVPLVPCTVQHYNFNEDIRNTAIKFNITACLCPPLGYQLDVGGKSISDFMSVFSIVIDRCNPNTTLGCANDTVFNYYQSLIQDFSFIIPIVNTEINPSDQSYKQIFIQDRNVLTFNSKMGIGATASIQQIIVDTDMSIFPYQNIVQQSFAVIPNLFTALPYLKTVYKPYASITFNKSPTTVTYTRSFNKLDNYFSYIGGIVGGILALMLIMRFYTQAAYQVSISHKLFRNSDKSQISSNSFSIFYFFSMQIQKLLSLCKCNVRWEKTQKFSECCQEMKFQLDISYLLRKLMYLETAVDVLFKKHQTQVLYFREKPQIERAKERRRKHFSLELIGKQLASYIENKETKQINDASPQTMNIQEIKELEQQSACQKVSNLSTFTMKWKSNQVQEIQACISKVLQQSKEGNVVSCKILNEVNPDYFPQIAKTQDYRLQIIRLKEERIQVRPSQGQDKSKPRNKK